jgi:hypothetical protein
VIRFYRDIYWPTTSAIVHDDKVHEPTFGWDAISRTK